MSAVEPAPKTNLIERWQAVRFWLSKQPWFYTAVCRSKVVKVNLLHSLAVLLSSLTGKDVRLTHVKAHTGPEPREFKYELTAFLRFKDEGDYLAEWLCFHMAVGFEHFYLYNNNSSDNFREVLQPFLDAGLVTLHDWPTKPASPSADAHVLNNYRLESRWIAFFDADEFLFPVEKESLVELLQEFRGCNALGANWHMFGSNGHRKRPQGLVLENYPKCASELNRHQKSIINPRRAIQWMNSHHFVFKGWRQSVDENHRPRVGTFYDPPSGLRIRCNHYYSKSEEDYLRKASPDWWVDDNGRIFKTHLESKIEEEMRVNNDTEDPAVLRFLPKTKELLAKYSPKG
ncbi:MAG: glycosyltransferase family 92 protein [Fimbriimonadaceae bacterium]|nr:glycosyltransferase family 92 protein [Fimbriimonadaceae bacterium]QYK58474.1 MAG: glycosyltransferase family 92 protein [Fimbriimonadaceae bacterium]